MRYLARVHYVDIGFLQFQYGEALVKKWNVKEGQLRVVNNSLESYEEGDMPEGLIGVQLAGTRQYVSTDCEIAFVILRELPNGKA